MKTLSQLAAQRLIQARVHRGWSQRHLGMRMGLPASVGSARINRYEHGRCVLGLDVLAKLAELLGVPCDYFVTQDEARVQQWLHAQPAPGQDQRLTG